MGGGAAPGDVTATLSTSVFTHKNLATVSSGTSLEHLALTGQIGPAVSGGRYKTDVVDMTEQGNVMDLFAKEFDYKMSNVHSFGLIAEEVAVAVPQLACYDEAGLPKSVRYDRLCVLLLERCRALRARISQLEAKK